MTYDALDVKALFIYASYYLLTRLKVYNIILKIFEFSFYTMLNAVPWNRLLDNRTDLSEFLVGKVALGQICI
jgi:hypothetical protein